jgi:HAD superfamily hydrolase (TIGR01509 family)
MPPESAAEPASTELPAPELPAAELPATELSARALPAAVLWDMDGTLIDTEPYWLEAEHLLVEQHGGTWSDEHALALVGHDLMDSARYIREHGPVPMEPEAIVDVLLQHVVAHLARNVPWRPGARELLAELRDAGVPCALVTMSWTALAETFLASVPSDTFEVVVTGDRVSRGKPHADPYLQAVKLLEVDADRCVAVEDSPTGVASATAAGVPTLVVPHIVPVPDGPGRSFATSLTDVDVRTLGRVASGEVLRAPVRTAAPQH